MGFIGGGLLPVTNVEEGSVCKGKSVPEYQQEYVGWWKRGSKLKNKVFWFNGADEFFFPELGCAMKSFDNL